MFHPRREDVYCDNQTVVKSGQKPEARLTKKHNAINFHRIREPVAANWVRIAFESGETNLADFWTKILPTWKRKQILQRSTYVHMYVLYVNGVTFCYLLTPLSILNKYKSTNKYSIFKRRRMDPRRIALLLDFF